MSYREFSNLIFATFALFGFLFIISFFLYIKNNSIYSLLIKYVWAVNTHFSVIKIYVKKFIKNYAYKYLVEFFIG